MGIYRGCRIDFQRTGKGFVVKAVNWLKQMVETRRSRSAYARQVWHPRILDQDILADIGIDATQLGNSRSNLASLKP